MLAEDWAACGKSPVLFCFFMPAFSFLFSDFFFPPLENIWIKSSMTNNKERGLDFNQALWVKPVWVSLFCTFVSSGQSNTKTTWNKTFAERTRNSWEKQLLLPPGASFNRTNLKCKITNSYLQPTISEEKIEYVLWKEGGEIPCIFLYSGWEGSETPTSFYLNIFLNAIRGAKGTTQ